MTPATKFDVLNCPLDGINLIEASAGTGKTWNICGLYLRLLLEQQLEVRQILVVTFTNAATAELRDRIRSRITELRDHLSGKPQAAADPFISELTDLLTNRKNFARENLLERLELALQTFDEASIFTIHGFCQRALADSAFTAGQAFGLELVPDDGDLLLEATHDFWRTHIAGNGIGVDLAAYLLQKKDTPEKFAALLKRHLAKPLAQSLWPKENPAEIDHAKILAEAYFKAQQCWAENRGAIVEKLYAAQTSLKKNIYNEPSIRQAATDYDDWFGAGDPLSGNISKLKCRLLRSSALTQHTKAKATPPSHPFFELAETLLAEREQTERMLEYKRLQLIRKLLTEAGELVRQRKRERQLLSFDDILYNVQVALKDNAWLAQLLRERFPAALVDEFQDTDPVQFAVFNTIYGSGQNPLFLVGDPKQAIYRFRNADLGTYLAARNQTSACYGIYDNQRSTQKLIEALNHLFSANPQAFMLPGLVYQQIGYGQKARKRFDDRSEQRADLQVWMLPKNEAGHYIERQEARHRATLATAGEIARLLSTAADGKIMIGNQPLQAGDIAVLVRTHTQGTAIRQALADLNVGSVELSQSSVFKSKDAEDVERILAAVWSPARLPLVRAALATELFGYDATALAALSDDEPQLMQKIQALTDYRHLWLEHGIGYAYRQLLSKEGVSERLLQRPDGERRMTNLLHLGELLHQASEVHPAPDALLRWLQTQRREAGSDEAAQLRLESDKNLVQILTIHKAKGLEFPVVFCPFLWDGYHRSNGGSEGIEYHDAQENTLLDYRPEARNDDLIKEQISLESNAEDLRLIYVALTRAVYRCYLVAGCYSRIYREKPSASESIHSLLHWLVAGNGSTPNQWKDAKLANDDIEHAWSVLAENSKGSMHLAPLPSGTGQPIDISLPAPETLTCQQAPKWITAGWRISSFSGLSRAAVHENAASDHDISASSLPVSTPLTAELPEHDILLFPRGTNAGDCIHKAFELCDFTDPAQWEQAIAQACSAFPETQLNLSEQEQQLSKKRLYQMMHDVLNTRLPQGIMLSCVAKTKRLSELGFHLPQAKLSASALNQALLQLDYKVPRLSFGELKCYLKGFIDLVFEHENRYYILDWKSNHLGYQTADYGQMKIAEAMTANGYHLQHLLYSIALNRYLAHRIRDYRYDTHFGGVLYLFVRGVRPGWLNPDGTPSGVYFHRPAEQTIRRLDAFFTVENAQAA